MWGIDCKRGILAGIIAYAIGFLVISATMFTPIWGTDASTYLNMAIVFIAVFLVANMFYFKKKPKNPLNEGAVLGLTMAIVAFLIEIPVMAYGFAAEMGLNWFAQWNILAGYVLSIIAAIVAAMQKK